jgi:hypothetical protein
VIDRCYLVYALAPEGMSAREANERLNEYVGDRRCGVPVFHDHFVGRHGGVAVFHVRSDEERSAVEEAAPLGGWKVTVHPLTFALAATGFLAQASFTLERYAGTNFAELAESEPSDPRHWWKASAS